MSASTNPFRTTLDEYRDSIAARLGADERFKANDARLWIRDHGAVTAVAFERGDDPDIIADLLADPYFVRASTHQQFEPSTSQRKAAARVALMYFVDGGENLPTWEQAILATA